MSGELEFYRKVSRLMTRHPKDMHEAGKVTRSIVVSFVLQRSPEDAARHVDELLTSGASHAEDH